MESHAELLVFSQALQVVHTAGFPLSSGLEDLARNTPPGKAREWSETAALRLQGGSDLAHAVADLPGMDPLLVSLLRIPAADGLSRLLLGYSRFLLYLQAIGEALRAALIYPMIMLWAALANVVLMNLTFLPLLAEEYTQRGKSPGLMIQMMSPFDFHYWPQALLFPAVLAFLAIEGTRLYVNAGSWRVFHSPLGRLLKLPEFARLEESGRLLHTLGLFLDAGQTLSGAIRQASRFAQSETVSAEFVRVGETLESGRTVGEAFRLSSILKDFSEGWKDTDPVGLLAERFKNMAGMHEKAARSRLRDIPIMGLFLGLALIGGVVLLLSLAFFQPYFDLVGSAA